MEAEGERAASEAAAQVKAMNRFYQYSLFSASHINDILARLILGLASPHLASVERATVLDRIDRLLRLKVDLGLVKGVHHVR